MPKKSTSIRSKSKIVRQLKPTQLKKQEKRPAVKDRGEEAGMFEKKQEHPGKQGEQQPEQDPSKHDKPQRGPANPAEPDENQENNDAAKQARSAGAKQTIDKLKDKYVSVQTLAGSDLPFQGTCLKCGWATQELTEDAAKKLVEAHVAIHWRDATPAGAGGLLGAEANMADLRQKAMQAQEKGAQKGGQEALKPVEQEQKQREQKLEDLVKQLAQQAQQQQSGQQAKP
jgi:hypothetical protein